MFYLLTVFVFDGFVSRWEWVLWFRSNCDRRETREGCDQSGLSHRASPRARLFGCGSLLQGKNKLLTRYQDRFCSRLNLNSKGFSSFLTLFVCVSVNCDLFILITWFWIGSHSDPQCAQCGLWAHEARGADRDQADPHQHHPAGSLLDSGGKA